MDAVIRELGEMSLAGKTLDRSQGLQLADVEGDALYDLFYWANRVRTKFLGNRITLCSIVAGRLGGCTEDCRFCAQSSRYCTGAAAAPQLADDESIVQAGREAADRGAEAFGVVNSGRGPSDADIDRLAGPIARLRADGRTRLCAALGALTEAKARKLVQLGITCYNHNLETSPRFYSSLVTTHPFAERVNTLRAARAAGMRLCCGGIFNVGENWADRIDMALVLREHEVEIVPLNFLHPIPGTPLADQPAMPPLEILKVVAIYRLMLPTRQLKLAGGRVLNLRDLQSWMFYCGASSAMVGNYLTTVGRPADDDRRMFADLGLSVQ